MIKLIYLQGKLFEDEAKKLYTIVQRPRFLMAQKLVFFDDLLK